ncbi:MAG: TetR/AcrR family transcriptional regulator [Propionibacteriales bacterium]|nr:TetR/AcrR family transcriptional regulator [Propionibacteriales bacterium]
MRENRRTQIVSSAVALARADGLDAVTYDAIARRLGISKAGVVYHFPQRGDVLRAMVEQTTSEVAGAVERHHEQTGKPRMVSYVILLLDGVIRPESPGLSTAIATDGALARGWRDLLATWTEELAATGVDPDDVRTGYLAATAGVWALEPGQLAGVRRTILELLSNTKPKKAS